MGPLGPEKYEGKSRWAVVQRGSEQCGPGTGKNMVYWVE